MTVSMNKVTVALNHPTAAPKLIVFANMIVERMTNNSWFPQPVPALSKVQAAVDALQDKQVMAELGGRAATAARNAARTALVSLLRRLVAYVQGVADDNPDHAVSIIESAGMSVAKHAVRVKPLLTVTHGSLSGTARLVAKAVAKKAAYKWQKSPDGGTTWLDLPQTLQAKTAVEDLVPGTTVLFRVQAVTKSGARDWSHPVALFVL